MASLLELLQPHLDALEDIASRIDDITIEFTSCLSYDGLDDFALSPSSSATASPSSSYSPLPTPTLPDAFFPSHFTPPDFFLGDSINDPELPEVATEDTSLCLPHLITGPGLLLGHRIPSTSFEALEGGKPLSFNQYHLLETDSHAKSGRSGCPCTLGHRPSDSELFASRTYAEHTFSIAETGSAEPDEIAHSIARLPSTEIAAVCISDQTKIVSTSRKPTLRNSVVSRTEFLSRIRAAIKAKSTHSGTRSDVIIIARTDCALALGIQEAIDRMHLAVEAGADLCVIEGITTPPLLEKISASLSPTPILVNLPSSDQASLSYPIPHVWT